jgi:hypothetical protein
MWQQLTPADIARVKHQLSLTRAETLSRHAAELKTLDSQQEEIEEFEILVAEFSEKYLNGMREKSTEALKTTEKLLVLARERVTAQDAREPETPEVPPRRHAEHRVPPNFGIPLRRAQQF